MPRRTRAAEPATVHYPIRAASRLSGVGIDTLRAWERRHGAVTPQRDDRGRLYTDEDVARLRLLREAVSKGHSIGRIATLDLDALRHLVGRTSDRGSTALPDAGRRAVSADVQGFVDAVKRFDRDRIELDLRRAAALLQPGELLEEVIAPLLTRVGDDWHAGLLTIAHEHFASEIVRNVLGAMLSQQGRGAGAKRLLFTTPPGELHEVGILGAALLASSGGLGTVYLGPDLSAEDILSSVGHAAVDAVVLGITASAAVSAAVPTIVSLSRHLPPRVELWLGGPAAPDAAERAGRRALVLTTYRDFERELGRLGGRLPPSS